MSASPARRAALVTLAVACAAAVLAGCASPDTRWVAGSPPEQPSTRAPEVVPTPEASTVPTPAPPSAPVPTPPRATGTAAAEFARVTAVEVMPGTVMQALDGRPCGFSGELRARVVVQVSAPGRGAGQLKVRISYGGFAGYQGDSTMRYDAGRQAYVFDMPVIEVARTKGEGGHLGISVSIDQPPIGDHAQPPPTSTSVAVASCLPVKNGTG
ncbi:hypothetical protein AB0M43_05120 [Longispora sp. NPDC051575]|uniref:hypothetical protein n=1 Tax=Longispora sp. NPDC051575 TaxID=3154943 RepID=UPI00341251B0